jgi:hypothetical protein
MARTDVILTPDQRVRVFISSTLEELAAGRAAARRAISRLRLVPTWYESGARPHPQRRMYRALRQARAWLGGLTGAEFTAFAGGQPGPAGSGAHPADRRGKLPVRPALRGSVGLGPPRADRNGRRIRAVRGPAAAERGDLNGDTT